MPASAHVVFTQVAAEDEKAVAEGANGLADRVAGPTREQAALIGVRTRQCNDGLLGPLTRTRGVLVRERVIEVEVDEGEDVVAVLLEG